MTVINTNVSALRAQNSSRVANRMQSQAMERLSSGKRINSAKDDAAGLAVATRMQAASRGFTQAIRNANDGISLAQTADSAAGSVSDILVRMRDLAMQASTGTLSDADRGLVQKEVTALISQIGDIVGQTTFNGNKLLDGSVTAGFDIQTGINTGENVNITIGKLDATTLGVNALSVATASGATGALATLDTAITAGFDGDARPGEPERPGCDEPAALSAEHRKHLRLYLVGPFNSLIGCPGSPQPGHLFAYGAEASPLQ